MADEHRDQDSEQREQEQAQQGEPTQQGEPATGQVEEPSREKAEQPSRDMEGQDLEVPTLEAEVEELQARLQQANEQVLRAQADAQNAMRRAEKDVEKAHKFGQERLISDLLVVVDNLERALGSVEQPEDGAVKGLVEGVELTLKSLVDALQRHNVEQIDPEGEPFNPELHQAMTAVESREVEPNTVLNVFQKGYTLHGRLVRPAMVVVSKAPVEA